MLSTRRIAVPLVAALLASAAAGACASAGPSGSPSRGPRPQVRGEEGPARPLTPEQQAARRVSRIAITPDSVRASGR